MESLDGKERSEWQAGGCTVVNDFEASEIVRAYKKDNKFEPAKYYNKLRFTVNFPTSKTFKKRKQSKPNESKVNSDIMVSGLEQIPEGEGEESPGRESHQKKFDFPNPRKN